MANMDPSQDETNQNINNDPAQSADSGYWDQVDEAKFMDFGAKNHAKGDVHPYVGPQRPSLHFRLIKKWYTKDHSNLKQVSWAVLALFIGIAMASFITQAVLVARDYVIDPASAKIASNITGKSQKNSNPAILASTTQSDSNQPAPNLEGEARGSDDANATTSTMKHYKLASADKFPKLSSKGFLIGDVETGEIVYEQGEALVAPIASVSKLMTAVIAHEKMDQGTVAIVSRDSYNTYGSEGNLLLGEKIKLVDLMYPLLIESSNDGAEVIADAYPQGHAKFLEEMNKKATALGMTDTYYDDPSGLSAKNVSSVEDLFTLARYIYKKVPSLWDITRIRQYAIRGHTWINKNQLLQYDYFIGGKNGFIDEAKKTTVSIFNAPLVKGGSRPLVIVILKSDDRTGDVAKILAFLKKNGYYAPSEDELINI